MGKRRLFLFRPIYLYAFLLLYSTTGHADPVYGTGIKRGLFEIGRTCQVIMRNVGGLPNFFGKKAEKVDPSRLPEKIVLDETTGASLTRGQYAVLREALDSKYYDVRLLGKKDAQGKDQIVVLLGESHLKTKPAAAMGKRILEQFPDRILEGADFNKLAGGKAFKLIALGIRMPITKLGLREGSTIYSSKLEPEFRLFEDALKALTEKVLNGEEPLSTLPQKFPDKKLNAGWKFDGKAYIAQVEKLLKEKQETGAVKPVTIEGGDVKINIEKPGEKRAPVRNFALEEGFKPGFPEHLASLYFSIANAAVVMPALVNEFSRVLELHGGYSPAAHLMEQLFLQGNLLASMHLAAGTALAGTVVPRESNVRYLLNPILGIVTPRSRLMARNIGEKVQDNPDVKTLLTVVGQLHNFEIIDFASRNGFRSIALPTVEQAEKGREITQQLE